MTELPRIFLAALCSAWLLSTPSYAAADPAAPGKPADSAATAAPGGPSWIAHQDEGFEITATEVSVAQFRACIDAGGCESATAGERCNIGRAGHDDHPVNCVSYHGAEQYCAHVGGRVCTEPEWLAACRGTDDRAFPYGPSYEADSCNARSSALAGQGVSLGTAPVGTIDSCRGGLDGLYDMAGNVAEWVSGCKGDYCKFRGAGYMSNEPVEMFAGCTGVCSGNDKSLQSGVVGIRCCRAGDGAGSGAPDGASR